MALGGSVAVTRSRLVLEGSQAWTGECSPAFEDFYSDEYDAVLGFAYALSGSRFGAEDLAHDAFFAAYKNWDKVCRYDQPGAWVRRVVINLSVSSFRRRVAEARALARAALGERTALPDVEIGDPAFWGAVRALPRRQAQVVALFYLEDRPIAEIAEILGLRIGTVKSTLHDGRASLARRLREEVEE
jgi:RNA polymerase sigma-70 factor (ECF subfamily)